MSVNFDLYKTFYYVGKYQNITQAAKALYVTQPTVTHAIRTLEQALNCRLFIRSQKGVAFTAEGQKLYHSIAPACETIFDAENDLALSKSLTHGTLSIGASETTLHHFLIPYLSGFKKLHPDIRLKIYNSSTPDMLNELSMARIDFAILVMDALSAPSNMAIEKLTALNDIFIAGSDFYALTRSELSLSTLSEYPLITLEKSTQSRSFIDHVFRINGLTLNPDIELATTDLIVPFVQNNLGIGIVPEAFAHAALSDRKIFRLKIKEQIPQREICLVKSKKIPLSFAGEAFIQYLLSNNQPAH